MSFQFTPEGLQTESFDEIFTRLVDGYKAIYGNDISVDQDAPDGQRVGIQANAELDLQAFATWLYNSLDPNLASGVALNRLLKLIGITRRPAAQSQWDLTLEADAVLTLPAGYTVEDEIGQTWSISTDVNLSAGSNLVTFRSDTFGSIEGLAGSEIEQATVVVGVASITALSDALVGIDEETDEELRIRRNKSLENPAYSTIGGLFAKLANVAGVTDLAVYENDTDTTDADGIPAHYIYCVVEGGTVDDIVETITKNKTAGAGTLGNVSGTFEETLIRPDGSEFIVIHDMQFDRPTEIDVYVNVTATRRDSAVPIDTALIAEKIASMDLNIGDNLLASSLYAEGYQAGNGFFLTDLEISEDDITYTDERLISGLDEKFVFDAANVTVTEVI